MMAVPPSPSLSLPFHSTWQMRSTGIPELTCVEDTDYIRNALVLDKNEHEAEHLFRKVTKKCLDLKGPFKWCGRFIFWGEAERCVLRHVSSYLHRYIGLCVSVHKLHVTIYTCVCKLWVTHYICLHKQCYVVINMCILHVCKCRMFVLLESNTFPFFK